MKSESSNSSILPIFYLTIGFVIGAVVVGSSWLATRESASHHNVVHNVTVSYMYESSPGGASGNNKMPVDSIQFYPGYIVVNTTAGHSNLYDVDRLREFVFSPTVSN